MGILTVIWEKWVEFESEWLKVTISSLISPLLYMIALGWGLGSMVDVSGRPYIDFLIPGIIALTTMNTSFSATAVTLNVQRLYEHSFDQVMISPTPITEYIIGQAIGGALRGVYGGLLILLVALPFGASINITPLFCLVMLLNGMAFSAFGVMAAILAKTHADVSRYSTYAILPMTFLCNTVFPMDRLPKAVAVLIQAMPLTHASALLRSEAYGESVPLVSLLLLCGFMVVFVFVSIAVTIRRENL